MPTLNGEYLGMPISISEVDEPNQQFFRHCGSHSLHLQRCDDCQQMRYPATNACPFCASFESTWAPVSGKGTLYSYGEVHHAINPVFRKHTPYLLLLVELDEQRHSPEEYDGLRFTGNLVAPDGEMASPEMVQQVGIGSRLKVVFVDIGDGMAIPQWTLDEESEQPERPWRYPIE